MWMQINGIMFEVTEKQVEELKKQLLGAELLEAVRRMGLAVERLGARDE